MPNQIDIQDFRCGYTKFKLDEISFSVKRGILAGIIGPNGSGKTTLFRGITSELSALNGDIKLSGQSVLKMSLKEKAQNIAIVSQFTEKIDVSVRDYVLMGRFPYRKRFELFEKVEDVAIANKYMLLTGVDKYQDKLMSELSGGQQQLAAIARALTQEPKVLLLDEPTAHLDISHAVQVLNLIQKLNDELELTVLMIIHDLNLASEFCDYLVLMKDGGIVKQGSPTEVINYQTIEDVYNTVVITQENPLSKKPSVFLISDKVLKQSV